jgi:hypothetical protein
LKKVFIVFIFILTVFLACAPVQSDKKIQSQPENNKNPIKFSEKWHIHAEFNHKEYDYDFTMIEKPYIPNPRNPETYAEIQAGMLKGQLFQYQDFGINIQIFFNPNIKITPQGANLENYDLSKTEPALWCYVRVDWNTELNKYRFNGRSFVGTLNTDPDLELEDGCRLEKIN